MKISFLIIFISLFTQVYSQSENLALEYYRNGDFIQAELLFEEIYKKKKVKSIYEKYLNCLIKNESYKKAEKIIKNFYRKSNNPIILIDLGGLYKIQGKNKLAYQNFNNALQEGETQPKYLASIGSRFFKDGEYELALLTYQLLAENTPKPSYSIQIANIYSHLGDVASMYQELIDLIEKHPQYFQSAKNMIARSITDDTDNENNQKLKKTLLRSIQKNNTYEVSKMLVWLFTQESQFDQALKCEISIDKRFLNNTASIISTSEIALSNEDYETAISGLEYVVKNSHSNSYAYEYSTLKILDIKFQIIDQQKVKKKIDLEKMGNE